MVVVMMRQQDRFWLPVVLLNGLQYRLCLARIDNNATSLIIS